MKKVFFILLLAGSGHFSFSQQFHFEPVHYKGEGSTNIFTQLTQDHLGYIWIASSDSGFYRYGGTDFINCQHNDKNANSVSHNSTGWVISILIT
jgi:ligand-binding sensor domain-containing protein